MRVYLDLTAPYSVIDPEKVALSIQPIRCIAKPITGWLLAFSRASNSLLVLL